MNPAAYAAKQKNARRILDYIINHGETSRVTLSGVLGLSTATVTNIVTELMEQNLVYESRQEHSTVGRKTNLLQFNANLCRVLSVALAIDKDVTMSICNLFGVPEVTVSRPCRLHVTEQRSEVEILRNIISIIEQFLNEQPETLRNEIRAVGVCVGGMVNMQRTADVPIVNWKNFNLVMPLRAALRLPIYTEGITRIKAIYEMRFIDPSEKNVLYLNLSTGIGMVHFFNGKMVMGKTGIAGEAGHISLNAHGPKCYCGNRGCFEYYCGMNMILDRAAELLTEENKNDVLYDLVVRQGQTLNAALLFRSRDMGSLVVQQLLSNVAEYLGAGIAALYNIFDPDRIILSGYLKGADDYLIESAITEAKSRIVNRFSRDLVISRAHLESTQVHLAVSSYVLKNLLDEMYR